MWSNSQRRINGGCQRARTNTRYRHLTFVSQALWLWRWSRSSQAWLLVVDSRLANVAANAGKQDGKTFYQVPADWEKQHLETLRTPYNSVRTDFFAASSFSPF